MNATSVASSSQMFSPFSQKTQGSSEAFNPFAPRQTSEGASFGPDGAGGSNSLKKNKRKTGFVGGSDTERKLKVNNPFKGKDGSLSDSGRQWKKRDGDGEKKTSEIKKNTKKVRGETKGLHLQKNDGRGNGVQPATSAEDDSTSRPSSSSSASSVDEMPDTASMRDADPYTKKVYDRLRKDGISPPSWPSQPGDPKSKAEMAKFRDKYEEYRKRVRVSLTKAALIDDPDKRKTLQNAINFRGICEDMCPEYEKITRITELDVPQHEKDARTGFAKTSRMVKKLARSAAGQEAPLPMDVRSTAALRRTLDYLIDDLLRDDENLPGLHGFLWDRTRAIRRDFTFFSAPTADDLKTQAYVLENVARFHVTALHLLSKPGKAGEDFVEQQELEQLGKALLSLRDLYDDGNAQGITCENEAEFRAYYLLFHAHDSNTIEMLQRQWKPHFWRDSNDVRTAVSLVEALQDTSDFHGPLKAAPFLAASNAFHSFFRIVEDPSVSYTMACFAECHFPQLRRSILRAVKRAMARPKDPTNDLTAASLNKFLRFDTIQEAIDFANLHGIDFVRDRQAPMDASRQFLALNNKEPLLHPRLHHQFSQTLVEKKRGNRPLPDVIHTTIYEDSSTSSQLGSGSFSLHNEGSLFIQDSEPETSTESPPSEAQPSSGFGSNLASTNRVSVQTTSIFGAAGEQKSTALSNPFASASRSFGNNLASGSVTPAFSSNNTPATTNPFASVTSSNAFEKPTTQPTLLGGGTTINPFAQAAPTPSGTFQGLQGKTPLQPQIQSFGNQSGFPSSSSPTFVNGITPAPKISFGAPGEHKPALSGPFASGAQISEGNKASTFPTATSTGQATSSLFASPSPPLVPASTSKSASSTSVPAVTTFPASTETSSSILSSKLGSKPPVTAQEQPKLNVGNALPSFPQTGGSLNFSSPNLLGSQAAKGGISSSPFSGSLLGSENKKNPQPPVQSQPGTLQPSSVGFPVFDPPRARRSGDPGGSTTPTSSPPRNASAAFLFSTPTPAPGPGPSPIPASPPRDPLGDFTNWFVNGDKGLMKEFEVFMVESIVREIYDKFQKDEEERTRREKEEQDDAEAKRFRVYNLSLKYFYRWKKSAREKRLRHLRRSGREQFRAFREAQRAAQLREEQEAAQRIAKQKAELAALNRPDELATILRNNQQHKRKAEEALLASGVLSGVTNERRAVSAIFRNDYRPSPTPSINANQGIRSRSGSIVSTEGGSKTRALRERLLGEKPGRFRRSLPSISADSSPPEKSRISKVSERWRLKAMGIVQMPDGTALPESMVDEIRRGLKKDTNTRGNTLIRRASITGAAAAMRQQSPLAIKSSTEHVFSDNPLTINNKRKRSMEDEGETTKEGIIVDTDLHKRVISDADILIQELRAMRQEMEEGTTWFKSQNGKLQSEILSRGGTPLDESCI
ncbi:SAC3/GANP/Nin1/mts3/eIF-3 p25 family domain-containing protein [Trichoderma ceciliae]